MIIRVRVKPNSNRSCLEKIGRDYVAFLKEKAEDGKANIEVIKLICQNFKVNFRKVRIKNATSRKKIVEIEI